MRQSKAAFYPDSFEFRDTAPCGDAEAFCPLIRCDKLLTDQPLFSSLLKLAVAETNGGLTHLGCKIFCRTYDEKLKDEAEPAHGSVNPLFGDKLPIKLSERFPNLECLVLKADCSSTQAWINMTWMTLTVSTQLYVMRRA